MMDIETVSKRRETLLRRIRTYLLSGSTSEKRVRATIVESGLTRLLKEMDEMSELSSQD